ncbi:OmpA family protein [Desulfosarcina sp. OttesenSCG-928-B08]|nr:OmpA family protein [Desulfosarcina sp. OttesenSCG-928-B08]
MTRLNTFGKVYGSTVFAVVAILTLICLSMAGCATSPGVPVAPVVDTQISPMDGNDSVSQLGADLAVGRSEKLNLLSPYWFAKAEQSFADARKAEEKGVSPANVQAILSAGRADLRRAILVSATSRTVLAGVLKARETAMTAGAAKDADTFGGADAALIDLAKAVEQDDLATAEKGREKAISRYRELEVRALKRFAVDGARERLAQAKSDGARRIVPTPYDEMEAAIKAADAFISANPGARDDIQALSESLIFQGDRLISLTAAGNRAKSLSPEKAALFWENYLHILAGNLDVPDMRDQPLQTQMETLAAAAVALKADQAVLAQQNETLADRQAEIDALNMRLSMLEGKSRQDQMDRERLAKAHLEAEEQVAVERSFSRLQGLVRSTFKSNEAELHREDNRMVIRMKAMAFPVGKSTVLPAHYPLLGKLQKVIRGMNVASITVEGHTDATGAADANQRLSRQRAEAVRNYLIKNKTLPSESITAAGYGADRPIATNSTDAGRALNRRIDIVIVPR